VDSSAFLGAATADREVRVVVRAEHGEVRTPIWIVTVGPDAFVRSYRAEQGRWYQQVHILEAFPLELGGELVSVRPDPVHDANMLERVSDAYLTKNDGEPELAAMVSPSIIATTLRLVPVGE
jgi:hypothetical protein